MKTKLILFCLLLAGCNSPGWQQYNQQHSVGEVIRAPYEAQAQAYGNLANIPRQNKCSTKWNSWNNAYETTCN